ncbi:MAG TPA: hypothetical protein VJG29_00815 [Candidatus Paceibacterota bacterium]
MDETLIRAETGELRVAILTPETFQRLEERGVKLMFNIGAFTQSGRDRWMEAETTGAMNQDGQGAYAPVMVGGKSYKVRSHTHLGRKTDDHIPRQQDWMTKNHQ